jgi:hypothetical protein
MIFDVDGNSTSKSYFVGDSNDRSSLHFVYFSNPDLPAGNHTLTVAIHSVSGLIYAFIDYITYKPIFSTLADKPDFSEPDFTTPDPPSRSRDSATAVIAGATVGSLLLITILLTALWFFKKRQKKQQQLLGIWHENYGKDQ